MMNDWLITFRSVTFAQRGERILRETGINTTLKRTPRNLSDRGCGYCLHLKSRDALKAVESLREKQVPFGKLYAQNDQGKMEEREL